VTYFLFDASGLAKRYVPELGRNVIHLIFDKTWPRRTCCLLLGVGETTSILVRAHNGGKITDDEFKEQMASLRSEVLHNPDFWTIHVEHEAIVSSFAFIEKFSINSTDAIVLHVAIELHADMKAAAHKLVFVCSDKRLIRAAEKSGITVCDPEQVTLAEVQRLIDTE
jgi:predicted nucleic acid-binding protein